MFSKTADPTTAPVRPSGSGTGSNSTRSVLSSDLRVSGEITSTGIIEVLGEIDGTVTAHGLVVGTEGRVTGTVSAESVEVKGHLDGKVASGNLTVRSTAEVKADVSYSTLVIESGAQIEGGFKLNKTRD